MVMSLSLNVLINTCLERLCNEPCPETSHEHVVGCDVGQTRSWQHCSPSNARHGPAASVWVPVQKALVCYPSCFVCDHAHLEASHLRAWT